MSISKKIDKVFDVIAAIFSKISAVLLMVMVVSIATQIIGRKMGASVLWTEELSRYLLIWITYTGVVNILIKGDALCVDFLKVMYSKRLLKFLEIFIGAITLAISGFLTRYGYLLVTSPIYMRSTTPVMLWPKWFVYAVIPACMAIVAVFAVWQIVRAIISLFDRSDEEGEAEIYGHIVNVDEIGDEGVEIFETVEMKEGKAK